MTLAQHKQHSKTLPLKRTVAFDPMSLHKQLAMITQGRVHPTIDPVIPTQSTRSTTEMEEKRVKKRVRFASMASVANRNTNLEDLEKSWYQRNDYASFEQERRRTISALGKVGGDLSLLDPAEYCIEGLEQQLSTKQIVARKYRTLQYTRLVLRHQQSQRQMGISDPDSLQAVSEMFSKQSGKRAYLRAVINSALAA